MHSDLIKSFLIQLKLFLPRLKISFLRELLKKEKDLEAALEKIKFPT